MIDLARWRSLGLELAFDPARPPARLSTLGREQLADVLAHLDVERLVKLYPREPDGRLPLDEYVLLGELATTQPLRAPKACWLVVTSPPRRGSPQVLTLAIADETGNNFQHRWHDARWLWDVRHGDATEDERWGVRDLPVELLAPARHDEALGRLSRACRGKAGTPGERAALSILYVRAGRWRDAIALYGITHALDKLPARQYGVDPAKWQRALEAGMANAAPWRFPIALAALGKRQTEWKLINFPGETTAKRHCVVLSRTDGVPHLALGYTATNVRAADLMWRWPPDLERIALGKPAAALASGARLSGVRTSSESDLLAQIAANPTDLDVRRVYADVLAQRTDPVASSRGEFITLQLFAAEQPLDSAGSRRMRELERAHWRAWLGALGPVIDKATFERGFLATCKLGSTRTPFDAWRHVTTPRALAELSTAREIELADTVPAEVLRGLLAAPLRGLERLAIPPRLLEAVDRAVPVLELRVVDHGAVGELVGRVAFALPPVLRLAATEALYAGPLLATCLPQLDRMPAGIGRVALVSPKFEVAVTRDPRGRLSIVHVVAPRRARAQVIGTVSRALGRCADDAITCVRINGPLTALEREQLDLVVTRFAAARLEIDDATPG